MSKPYYENVVSQDGTITSTTSIRNNILSLTPQKLKEKLMGLNLKELPELNKTELQGAVEKIDKAIKNAPVYIEDLIKKRDMMSMAIFHTNMLPERKYSPDMKKIENMFNKFFSFIDQDSKNIALNIIDHNELSFTVFDYTINESGNKIGFTLPAFLTAGTDNIKNILSNCIINKASTGGSGERSFTASSDKYVPEESSVPEESYDPEKKSKNTPKPKPKPKPKAKAKTETETMAKSEDDARTELHKSFYFIYFIFQILIYFTPYEIPKNIGDDSIGIFCKIILVNYFVKNKKYGDLLKMIEDEFDKAAGKSIKYNISLDYETTLGMDYMSLYNLAKYNSILYELRINNGSLSLSKKKENTLGIKKEVEIEKLLKSDFNFDNFVRKFTGMFSKSEKIITVNNDPQYFTKDEKEKLISNTAHKNPDINLNPNVKVKLDKKIKKIKEIIDGKKIPLTDEAMKNIFDEFKKNKDTINNVLDPKNKNMTSSKENLLVEHLNNSYVLPYILRKRRKQKVTNIYKLLQYSPKRTNVNVAMPNDMSYDNYDQTYNKQYVEDQINKISSYYSSCSNDMNNNMSKILDSSISMLNDNGIVLSSIDLVAIEGINIAIKTASSTMCSLLEEFKKKKLSRQQYEKVSEEIYKVANKTDLLTEKRKKVKDILENYKKSGESFDIKGRISIIKKKYVYLPLP